ncbi:MAG: protein translocase subunit SecD [Actinomycetota bacterium]|jgi:preprotein translocase subunit SecD|nr:protein translocase subunit SecD [Actinomycetota bacterium]
MKKRPLWISLFVVVALAAVGLGATLGAGWSPKLGLDLDGGLSVVYQTAHPVSSSDLSTVANILNSRVDAEGASGATVATQGKNQIAVSIPGVKNTQQILNTLGQTAQLFFRPAICVVPPYSPKKGSKPPPPSAPLPACSSTALLTASNIAPTASNTNGNLASLEQASLSANAVFANYPSTPPSKDRQHATVLLPDAASSGGGALRYVLGPATVTGTAVKSASAQLTSGQWDVVANLTGPGATAWNTLAAQQFHAIIGVDLDGQVISAPITLPSAASFQSFGNTVEISGNFTATQAKTLATDLNYGALPVRLDRINVQTVSPTLGKSSLDAGLLSGVAGLLLVMVYMIFYYRLLGVVVVAGLVVSGSLLWAIISLMGQGLSTTIDLAGIIGLIVSVGITVDSYIVYFERLKDEARAGRTVRSSVDKGFARAFRTVLAADAVSFLGAAILYLVSIGPVRGFALFLGLSTILDVFVTYFFTRPFVILLGRSAAATGARYLGVARGLGMASEGAK